VLNRDRGDLDAAIDIWSRLKRNIEKHSVDKTHKGRNYPGIVLNLADCLHRAKRYHDAIEASDDGAAVCKETGFLQHFPFIMAVKAICLCELGNKEEGAKLLRQVYYTSELYDNKPAVAIIIKYAKDNGMSWVVE
jgi:tetratricopeptide (TPR) repeat protein